MTDKRISSLLGKIASDSVEFRHRLDDVIDAFADGRVARQQLFELLICTSELYLNYLLFMKDLTYFSELSVDAPDSQVYSSNVHREMELRNRFRTVLQRSKSWDHADLQNSLAELAGLRTRTDYIDSFTLHLPEIHEETYLVEECARHFVASKDTKVLTELTFGLQHLACNHISFVQPALQWSSVETSWVI